MNCIVRHCGVGCCNKITKVINFGVGSCFSFIIEIYTIEVCWRFSQKKYVGDDFIDYLESIWYVTILNIFSLY